MSIFKLFSFITRWWYRWICLNLVLLVVLGASGLVIGLALYHYFYQVKQPLKLGLIWSTKEAQVLALTEADLEQVLTSGGWQHLQVTTYWDQLQPRSADQFDFSQLETIRSLAEAYNLSLALQLGIHQTGADFCHLPPWAKSLQRPDFLKALENYYQEVLKYFDQQEVVEYYLEPEIFATDKNKCSWILSQVELERLVLYLRNLTEAEIVLAKKRPWLPIFSTAETSLGFNFKGFQGQKIPAQAYLFLGGYYRFFQSKFLIQHWQLDKNQLADRPQAYWQQTLTYLRKSQIKRIDFFGWQAWLKTPSYQPEFWPDLEF